MDGLNRSADVGSLERGVVAVIPQGAKWLVIRRSQFVRAPGTFCFPGGGIEVGESEEEALRREIREELACDVRPTARLWQSITPWRVALSWWRAELDPGAVLRPDPHEVASVHWLTPKEIRQLPDLLASNHQFLDAWEQGLLRWD